MQDHGEEKMKNKAKEEEKMVKTKRKTPTNPKYFHGSNKYTNGSHGLVFVYLFCVLFPTEM